MLAFKRLSKLYQMYNKFRNFYYNKMLSQKRHNFVWDGKCNFSQKEKYGADQR